MKAKKILFSVIIFILLVILIQNTQVVNINILFWTISMSQIILLLLIILFSFALGYLSGRLLKK